MVVDTKYEGGLAMKKIRHRQLMRMLCRRYGGDYSAMAKWLKGSKTYGDGTYNYSFEREREQKEYERLKAKFEEI